MEYYCIAMCVIVLLLAGCVPKEIPEEPTPEPEEEQIEEPTVEEEQKCTEMWICTADNAKAYRKSDCTFEQVTNCPAGCENGECKEEPIEEPEEEIEQEEVEEEIQPEQEEAELSEEEQIQQIFGYAETKIKSYSYKYKGPTGLQYAIYVKGNRIRISRLSSNNQIYLDTEKKTAEEWCISHTKCGRQTGKIADLDYYDAYIETPLDWLPKITEAKKIDEGFYYGKQAWKLDTNIGKVTIDSNFGFIYSIEQEDKKYLFLDAKFNIVKDSDVTIPEYLIE